MNRQKNFGRLTTSTAVKWLVLSFVVIIITNCRTNSNRFPNQVIFLDSLNVLEEFTFPDSSIEQLAQSFFPNQDSSLFEFLAFRIENFKNGTGFYYRCSLRDSLIFETLPFQNLNLNQDLFSSSGELLRISHDPPFAEITATDGTSRKFNFELHECIPAWLEVPTLPVDDGWLIPVRPNNLGRNKEAMLRDAYTTAQPGLFLSVKDSLTYSFFGAYPKSYVAKGVYGYDLHPFLAQDNRGRIIMSFPGSAQILIGSMKGKEFFEVSAKSYFDVDYNPMDKHDYMINSKAIKFQLETPKYGKIFHNKWTTQTYRIYRLPKGQIVDSREVTHSMLILDQEFKVLRELVFHSSVYSPEHIIPHPKGFIVVQRTSMGDTQHSSDKLMILGIPK